MQLSDIPAWFAKRFAQDAGGTYLRTVPATTGDPTAASMAIGFPPLAFTNVGAGGSPMDGRDMNGILNFVSAWSQWAGLGGAAPWSSTISTAAGGYPYGAVVLSGTTTGRLYQSQVENNTTNPDTGGAGWAILVNKAATLIQAQAGTSSELVITPSVLASMLANIGFTPGQIGMFGMTTPPTGWLKANGSAVSRTTYANLFAAIGTTWGVGDGSTTFNIPELRGEFPRFFDDGRGIDPSRVFASAQGDQNQAHTHSTSLPLYTVNPGGNVGLDANANFGGNFPYTSSSSGGSEARPRNVALLACVRY